MSAANAEHHPQPSGSRWHARSADDVLAGLQTTRDGLDPTEAARRLREHGPNRLPASRGRPPLLRFLAQFHNALIYFLVAAAAAAAFLGYVVDAAVMVVLKLEKVVLRRLEVFEELRS